MFLSVLSSNIINYNHEIFRIMAWLSRKVSKKGIDDSTEEHAHEDERDILLLGFHRIASMLVAEFEHHHPQLLKKLQVVEFNQAIKEPLLRRGIKFTYGDFSSPDVLEHCFHGEPKIIISTTPDTMLQGTTNMRILQVVQGVWPKAHVIVTADNPRQAAELYEMGAHYVLRSAKLCAERLFELLNKYETDAGMSDLKRRFDRYKRRENAEYSEELVSCLEVLHILVSRMTSGEALLALAFSGFASKLALQLMAASEDVSTRLPVLKPMDIYGTSVSQCAPAGNGRDDLASAAVRGSLLDALTYLALWVRCFALRLVALFLPSVLPWLVHPPWEVKNISEIRKTSAAMAHNAAAAFVSNFSLIALGLLLKRCNIVQETDGRTLLKLALNVATPALLLHTFVEAPGGTGAPSLALAAWFLSFGLAALGGWWGFREKESRQERALLTGMMTGLNLGMFSYPIIHGIFGVEGLCIVACLDIPNMIVNFAYNRAVFDGLAQERPSGARLLRTAGLQLLRAPAMVAIWVGLALRQLALPMPSLVDDTLAELGHANKVLVMMGLGILLKLRLPKDQRRQLAELLSLRCASGFAAAAGTAALAQRLGTAPLVQTVCVMALCCPIPAVSVQFALEVGCDSALAAAAANLSNLVAFPVLFAVASWHGDPAGLQRGLAGLSAASTALWWTIRRTRAARHAPTATAALRGHSAKLQIWKGLPFACCLAGFQLPKLRLVAGLEARSSTRLAMQNAPVPVVRCALRARLPIMH
ncbi:unnamed protein product [Symbiodinium microadriaticum]|nr:unnamed protein product [Symbiodinium microadriaticum]